MNPPGKGLVSQFNLKKCNRKIHNKLVKLQIILKFIVMLRFKKCLIL